MPKNNGFRLIHLIITSAVIFAACVAGWAWQQADTKAIAKEVVRLDETGCKPAQAIPLIKYRLDQIDKNQLEFPLESFLFQFR